MNLSLNCKWHTIRSAIYFLTSKILYMPHPFGCPFSMAVVVCVGAFKEHFHEAINVFIAQAAAGCSQSIIYHFYFPVNIRWAN